MNFIFLIILISYGILQINTQKTTNQIDQKFFYNIQTTTDRIIRATYPDIVQQTRKNSNSGLYVPDKSGKYKPDPSGFYDPNDRLIGFYDRNDRLRGIYNQTDRLKGYYDEKNHFIPYAALSKGFDRNGKSFAGSQASYNETNFDKIFETALNINNLINEEFRYYVESKRSFLLSKKQKSSTKPAIGLSKINIDGGDANQDNLNNQKSNAKDIANLKLNNQDLSTNDETNETNQRSSSNNDSNVNDETNQNGRDNQESNVSYETNDSNFNAETNGIIQSQDSNINDETNQNAFINLNSNLNTETNGTIQSDLNSQDSNQNEETNQNAFTNLKINLNAETNGTNQSQNSNINDETNQNAFINLNSNLNTETNGTIQSDLNSQDSNQNDETNQNAFSNLKINLNAETNGTIESDLNSQDSNINDETNQNAFTSPNPDLNIETNGSIQSDLNNQDSNLNYETNQNAFINLNPDLNAEINGASNPVDSINQDLIIKSQTTESKESELVNQDSNDKINQKHENSLSKTDNTNTNSQTNQNGRQNDDENTNKDYYKTNSFDSNNQVNRNVGNLAKDSNGKISEDNYHFTKYGYLTAASDVNSIRIGGVYNNENLRNLFTSNKWGILQYAFTIYNGGYHYLYSTSNGINAEEEGHIENRGTNEEGLRAQGYFSYVGPDGVTYSVRYVADKNGFQPEGDHIPKIPELIQRSLDYKRSIGLI